MYVENRNTLVAGVKSQTEDDFTTGEAEISMETAIPANDIISEISSASNGSPESSSEETARRKQRIIGGVDDERSEIRRVCPLESANLPDDLSNLSTPIECARTCNDNKPKICYYHFEAEIYSSLSA